MNKQTMAFLLGCSLGSLAGMTVGVGNPASLVILVPLVLAITVALSLSEADL